MPTSSNTTPRQTPQDLEFASSIKGFFSSIIGWFKNIHSQIRKPKTEPEAPSRGATNLRRQVELALENVEEREGILRTRVRGDGARKMRLRSKSAFGNIEGQFSVSETAARSLLQEKAEIMSRGHN